MSEELSEQFPQQPSNSIETEISNNCIHIEGHAGRWVSVSIGDRIIRAMNPGTTKDGNKYAYNRYRYGDVRCIKTGGGTRLYNVEDLLTVKIGIKKARKERKKRVFSEAEIRKLQEAQYRRRQREREMRQQEAENGTPRTK